MTRSIYCRWCDSWTYPDEGAASEGRAVCDKCGDDYECDECGYDVDLSGKCQREADQGVRLHD